MMQVVKEEWNLYNEKTHPPYTRIYYKLHFYNYYAV